MCLNYTQMAKFIGPTWGPPGSCQPQMGPIMAPWTLLSGYIFTWYDGIDEIDSHGVTVNALAHAVSTIHTYMTCWYLGPFY